MHVTSADYQEPRFAVTRSDLDCDFGFCRKMDVVTLHALQTVTSNPRQESRRRTVIQEFRRGLRLILQVHRERVSLTGANASAIVTERKPFFVARRDDVLKLI